MSEPTPFKHISIEDLVEFASMMKSLRFVMWDRFVVDNKRTIVAYGWIERKKDSYKDFVLLEYNTKAKMVKFTTSSAERTRKIAKILFGDDNGHTDCLRVEKWFDIRNSIKL